MNIARSKISCLSLTAKRFMLKSEEVSLSFPCCVSGQVMLQTAPKPA